MTGMGPEVFPRLLLGVLVFLAALLAFVARGKHDEAREPIPAMVSWTTAFIYLLFVKGFAIPLPRGLIGDWLV
jgi:hypothetical protein